MELRRVYASSMPFTEFLPRKQAKGETVQSNTLSVPIPMPILLRVRPSFLDAAGEFTSVDNESDSSDECVQKVSL